MKTSGITLILIGLALNLVTAVKVFTTEKVVDIGDVQITRQKPNYISWSPVLGIVVMIAGGILVVRGSAKRS